MLLLCSRLGRKLKTWVWVSFLRLLVTLSLGASVPFSGLIRGTKQRCTNLLCKPWSRPWCRRLLFFRVAQEPSECDGAGANSDNCCSNLLQAVAEGQDFLMMLSLLPLTSAGPAVLSPPSSSVLAWVPNVAGMQKLVGKGSRQPAPLAAARGSCFLWHVTMKLVGEHCASSGRETQQSKHFMRPQLSSHCLFGLLVQCWSPESQKWFTAPPDTQPYLTFQVG